MVKDMKSFVKKGYETGDYIQAYNRTLKKISSLKRPLFDELLKRIPKRARILDMGCGAGVPYTKFLVTKGHEVTGIDNSEKLLKVAKKLIKKAKFIEGDFSTYEFKGKYDAIVSFYAIFHIPRSQHRRLFEKIHSLLKKNGLVLITLGAEDMKLEVSEFIGSRMAWSSYSIEKNRKLLINAGFKILVALEDNRHEHHLWILAQKK